MRTQRTAARRVVLLCQWCGRADGSSAMAARGAPTRLMRQQWVLRRALSSGVGAVRALCTGPSKPPASGDRLTRHVTEASHEEMERRLMWPMLALSFCRTPLLLYYMFQQRRREGVGSLTVSEWPRLMARVEANTERIMASLVAMEALQRAMEKNTIATKETQKHSAHITHFLGLSGPDGISRANLKKGVRDDNSSRHRARRPAILCRNTRCVASPAAGWHLAGPS